MPWSDSREVKNKSRLDRSIEAFQQRNSTQAQEEELIKVRAHKKHAIDKLNKII